MDTNDDIKIVIKMTLLDNFYLVIRNLNANLYIIYKKVERWSFRKIQISIECHFIYI